MLIVFLKTKKSLKSGVQISEFVQGLSVISTHIFCKEKASLFSNQAIMPLLVAHGVTEIKTIGVDGSCCVAASAMEAAALGLTVVFPCAFIGVKNIERLEQKKAALKKLGVRVIE